MAAVERRHTDEDLRAIYDQSYVDQYDPHAVPRMRRMLPFFDLSSDDVVADFGCGNGVLLENHVIRHMGDIEVIHTYEGTETMQTLIVGRDITGIGAFA